MFSRYNAGTSKLVNWCVNGILITLQHVLVSCATNEKQYQTWFHYFFLPLENSLKRFVSS